MIEPFVEVAPTVCTAGAAPVQYATGLDDVVALGLVAALLFLFVLGLLDLRRRG